LISIETQQLGKRFGREWIFRGLNLRIENAEKFVITGSNGSGKSTLLQMLSGYVLPTEGNIVWKDEKNNFINKDSIYKHVAIASPALELIEEFSPKELIKHQRSFKKFQGEFSDDDLIELALLTPHKNKSIKHFSSGMKQRLKLLLASLSDTPLLLLDEPIINLDKTGILWYKELILTYAINKTIIVCSNKLKDEYGFCSRELSVDEFKNQN
jgi:ABC-type multidrug transport system ATPase subunit